MPLKPSAWARIVHEEPVWGTVVTIEVRGPQLQGAEAAVQRAADYLHQVDAWFSTYRIDTPVMAIRSGVIGESEAPEIVRAVLRRCAEIRDLTDGVFDPWSSEGGLDPSGYVKGWAADEAAGILQQAGWANMSINAAGDVACRGVQAPGRPWIIGIRHPQDARRIIATVDAADCAVATSGAYERGHHIRDPRSGSTVMAVESATVVGPDGGMADALATALLIEGPAGARWFESLPGWSALLVSDGTATAWGPAFPSP